MALSIKNEELDQRIRRLSELTGQGITTSLRIAVDNEIAYREKERERDIEKRFMKMREIQERVARRALPNPPSNDEILGYDEDGLPS